MCTSCKEYGSQDYQNHHVFKEIEHMMAYYDAVSFTCFSFFPIGAPGLANYASYIYLSLKGTLESILLILKAGQIADAFTLIRKYYDDVLVDIYFDIVRKDKFDWVENNVVKEVDEWITGKARIPKVEIILRVMKQSPSAKELYPFFDWDNELKQFRELLDDNVHSNSYSNMLMNSKDVMFGDRMKRLESASTILKQLFTIHLAFIFHLNGHYMMASDYMDCMEMNMTPPSGSERWLAPYAQLAFDEFIKPKMASFVREHCVMDIA